MALDHIQRMRRLNPSYSVIDLGGALGGWSEPVADLVVDIQSPQTAKSMPLDLCRPIDWDRLQDVVNQRGSKFDYAICTHTLEDLYDPIITLRRLPLIAHQGIITMPSIRTELSHVSSADWLGYIHHRWIFDHKNGHMFVLPKLPFLEHRYKNKITFDPQQFEICYLWNKHIPFEIISNNYFASIEHVITSYDQHILQSLQLTAPG